ncbi:uroporphyrinogen-III C-methyltransferase [Neptunomonas phycophila]|uniref:uroporphyrinogen-III C-methyltransferase n=1 Tax=Neptunomonas phycophila TaxID=1572645 RepID=UPI0023F87E69|nr:uroporphyrinogen-III C-methyltransferase [Neptunomonas phycophila]
MKETGKHTDDKQDQVKKDDSASKKPTVEAQTSNDTSDPKPDVAKAADTESTAAKEPQSADNKPEVTEPTKEIPADKPTPVVAAVPQAEEKKPSTWPGKLALVISIIALGATGYIYWHDMQKQQQESADIEALKAQVSEAINSANATVADAKSLVSTQVSSVNQSLTMLQNQTAKEQAGIAELQERLTQSIQQVQAKQTNTRKDWLLAESEYLLRLANQRVMMEQTPVGALALLKSADKILKETDDVSIYAVRKALAEDIASLEAVPTFDLEGSYLKLAALNNQVNNLRLIPLTEKNQLPSLIEEMTPDTVDTSLMDNVRDSWAKAVDKFEKLVVIQHHDKKIEPLLSPEQNYYLQQNLHLMLEQAQLALLQRKQVAFDRSLDKAEEWLSTYFEADDATTQSLLRGVNELKSLQISPQMPDISGSLNALKSYLQKMTDLKAEGAA